MKNKILIISGDPNSINSEIIFKSWKKISFKLRKKIYIISNYNLLKSQFKKLGINSKVIKVKNISENPKSSQLKVLDVGLKFKDPFKLSKKMRSKFVQKSLDIGHNLALKQKVKGIINCPIDKNLLNKKRIGVTEYLASKCDLKKNTEVMLIKSKMLGVCPITTHIDLKQVNQKINKNIIINKIITLNRWYKRKDGRRPKIGVLGLNPHNAELRKDSKERKVIIPSIKKLKKLKINVKGPLVADTLFINDYKKFDIIIGMYHDQVLTPFKTLFKFDAINITLGLKYLRLSPDHGTAIDLIAKDKANPVSLIKCIEFVDKFKI